MPVATARTQHIRSALLRWYGQHGRDLPWRRTRDPYRILVSEVMLQQTQVDRVKPYYRAWLARWPTVRALARASRADVIRAWSGLGYNRRAVNIHRAAQAIVAENGGRFPQTVTALEALPGIGPYTARAAATFAGFTEQAFLDTNARRVLGRVAFGWFFPSVRADRRLLKAARRLLPPRRSAAWHHALMDLGALICKPRPLCHACPLRQQCRAYPRVLTATRPRRSGTERFEDSDRYWRGQIVKQLAALPNAQTASFASLRRQCARLTGPRLRGLLRALVQEGLVVARQPHDQWVYALGG